MRAARGSVTDDDFIAIGIGDMCVGIVYVPDRIRLIRAALLVANDRSVNGPGVPMKSVAVLRHGSARNGSRKDSRYENCRTFKQRISMR
jgi:hypothetical protein